MGNCGGGDAKEKPHRVPHTQPPKAKKQSRPAHVDPSPAQAHPKARLPVSPKLLSGSTSTFRRPNSLLFANILREDSYVVVDGEKVKVSGATKHAYEKAIELYADVHSWAEDAKVGKFNASKRWHSIFHWIMKQGRKSPKDGPAGYRVFLFRYVLKTIEYSELNNLNLSSGPPSTRSDASRSSDDELEWVESERTAGPSPEALREVWENLTKKKKDGRWDPQLPSPEMATEIVKSVTQILSCERNVVEVEVPLNGKVIVVGDTHGNFSDLMYILEREKTPSALTQYVFNGDFVDRGLMGVEIVLSLFCLKLLHPQYIHLNRGNHEEERINKYSTNTRQAERRGKFKWQVEWRYPSISADTAGVKDCLFALIQRSFMALPLITILKKGHRRKIAIVHGGLPDEGGPVTLEEINRIERRRECPKSKEGRHHLPNGTLEKTKTPPERRDDRIFQGLLWSDPRVFADGVTSEFSRSRGAGMLFGPSVSKQFLDTNSIDQHIIRSHENIHRGHVINHQDDDRVLCETIFSASNYMNNTNMGAFIIVTHGSEDPETNFVLTPESYYVRSNGDVFVSRRTHWDAVFEGSEAWARAEVDQLVSTAIEFLGQFIFRHRFQLLHEFQARDPERTGRCATAEWVNVMRIVVSESMPWWGLCRYLCRQDLTGGIAYVDFVERFQNKLSQKWMMQWCAELMLHTSGRVSRLAKNVRSRLEAQAQRIASPRSMSGAEQANLNYDEFSSAVGRILAGVPPIAVFYLRRVLDENEDGYVDVREWEKKVNESRGGRACPAVLDFWDLQQQKGDGSNSPYLVFLKGIPRSGITEDAFVEIGMKLCNHSGKDALQDWNQSAAVLSTNKMITRESIENAVNGFKGKFNMVERVMEVIDSITKQQTELKYVFEAMDTDRSGTISRAEFVAGLEKLDAHSDSSGYPLPIDQEWVDTLWREVDVDKSGSIDLEEFLDGLTVQDTWQHGFERTMKRVGTMIRSRV